MDKPRVTIIGAGVIGLSTAVRLVEAGYPVTVRARELHPHITSSVAAAIWFPYEAAPAAKVKRWGIRSFRVYEELASDSQTGVTMTECRWVSDHEYVRPDWSFEVGSLETLKSNDLPDGYTHGYRVFVPLIETPIFMPYLLERFRSLGGEVHTDSMGVKSLEEPDLAPITVNCSGLGASQLADDQSVFPIRGQVVVVDNPGISYSTCDDESANAVCYVIPRSNDCILGGVAVHGDWSTDIDDDLSRSILERCEVLDPRLVGATARRSVVGLRPGRDEVRLEIERLSNDRTIIHNYGHGGAGFTLAWGCAEDILAVIKGLTTGETLLSIKRK